MRIYFDEEPFDYVDDDFIVHTTEGAREFELSTAFMLTAEYRKLSYRDRNIQCYELSDDQQTITFYARPEHEDKHWTGLPGDMTIRELDNYCDKHDLHIAYDGTLQRAQSLEACVWVADCFTMPVSDIEDILIYLSKHKAWDAAHSNSHALDGILHAAQQLIDSKA